MGCFLKKIKIIIPFFFACILTSCGLFMGDEIEKNATDMMKCIVNKDLEGTFSFFCDDLKNNNSDFKKMKSEGFLATLTAVLLHISIKAKRFPFHKRQHLLERLNYISVVLDLK